MVDIPINSGCLFSNNRILVGGGGGSTKSGIKNKVILMEENGSVIDDIVLQAEEDSVMALTTVDNLVLFCANDTKANIAKGINNDIRVYNYNNDKKIGQRFEFLWSGQAIQSAPEQYVRVIAVSPSKNYFLCGTTEKTIIYSLVNKYEPMRADMPDEIYDIDFIDTNIAIVTMPTQIAILEISADKIENLFILPPPSYPKSNAAPVYRCARHIVFGNKSNAATPVVKNSKMLIVTNIGRSNGHLCWFDIKKTCTTKDVDDSDKENKRRKSLLTTSWNFEFNKSNKISPQSIRSIAVW